MDIVYLDDADQQTEEWDLLQRLALPKQIKVTLSMAYGDETLTFTATASPPLAGIRLQQPGG